MRQSASPGNPEPTAIDIAAHDAALMRALMPVLFAAREAFGNDLDKIMILNCIGIALCDATDRKEEQSDRSSDRRTERAPNIDYIVRRTGIPRESVRRKVNELIADGLVIRPVGAALAVSTDAPSRLHNLSSVSRQFMEQVWGARLQG